MALRALFLAAAAQFDSPAYALATCSIDSESQSQPTGIVSRQTAEGTQSWTQSQRKIHAHHRPQRRKPAALRNRSEPYTNRGSPPRPRPTSCASSSSASTPSTVQRRPMILNLRCAAATRSRRITARRGAREQHGLGAAARGEQRDALAQLRKLETMEESAIAKAYRALARGDGDGLVRDLARVDAKTLAAALQAFLEEDSERWALAREVYRSSAFVRALKGRMPAPTDPPAARRGPRAARRFNSGAVVVEAAAG